MSSPPPAESGEITTGRVPIAWPSGAWQQVRDGVGLHTGDARGARKSLVPTGAVGALHCEEPLGWLRGVTPSSGTTPESSAR
jgi:hypothetical protein